MRVEFLKVRRLYQFKRHNQPLIKCKEPKKGRLIQYTREADE